MGKDKVLVVDNDKSNRDAIRILLELNDVEVKCTNDGHQALKLLDSEPFNLIICGLPLEHVITLELLNAAKGNPNHYRIPFVIITESVDEAVERQFFNAGAEDIITKPYSSKALLNTVRTRVELAKKHNRFLQEEVNRRVFTLLNHNFNQEILTPVNGVENALFLMNNLPGAENVEGLDEVNNVMYASIFRIKRTTQNLLTYALMNIENNSDLIEKTRPIELHELLRKVQVQLTKGGIQGLTDIQVAGVQIGTFEGPYDVIRQIFTELIDNAAKFNQAPFVPEIKLEAINNEFTFSVTSCLKEHVNVNVNNIAPFKKFHKDISRNGLGLGLYVCKSLVERAGYRMAIKKDGNYVTFTVSSVGV